MSAANPRLPVSVACLCLAAIPYTTGQGLFALISQV